jgi:hypothetical protein
MSALHGEEKAIEVATLLGDSVVDVKHCMDPQGGKVSPRTWGMLAAGAACLLASAAAFYTSVSTAAYNKSALHYWTHVAHKPAHAYRPELVSAGYDWLAFGGLVLGLCAVVIGLVRMRGEKKSPYYRIGTAPGVEQPLEGAPAADFPLVAPSGNDFVFNFGAGMTGELIHDNQTTPLAELAASGRAVPSTRTVGAFELPIPQSARIRAKVGQTSFLVTAVPKPRAQGVPLLALESRTMTYFAGSLGAHLALVLLLSYVPVESGTATIDIGDSELTAMKSNSTEKEDLTPEEQVAMTTGGGGQEASGRSMRLEEGAAGTTKSTKVDGHMRIKNNNLEPQLARLQAIEEARSAGVLGSVALTSGSAFASLTATANLSSGPDGVDVWGPIYGADGEAYGHFGIGRRGFGAGGGCTQEPCGIIGTPTGYGKIGLGRFAGSGWDGPGGGAPGMKRHVPGVPQPVIGTPTGTDGLDKSIIRRYIKRNVDKIAYCYEKQLLAHPGIGGSIMVTFFITPAGSVKSSVGSGFDATVANCVADVVGSIEFPKPNGGVQVNYPFTFHPAGN